MSEEAWRRRDAAADWVRNCRRFMAIDGDADGAGVVTFGRMTVVGQKKFIFKELGMGVGV